MTSAMTAAGTPVDTWIVVAFGTSKLPTTAMEASRGTGSDTPVNQRLMEYAEISRAVASTSGAHLCDLRAAFETYLQTHNPDKAYKGILTSDGVHLNDMGNRFVARLMLDHLRPLWFRPRAPYLLTLKHTSVTLKPRESH